MKCFVHVKAAGPSQAPAAHSCCAQFHGASSWVPWSSQDLASFHSWSLGNIVTAYTDQLPSFPGFQPFYSQFHIFPLLQQHILLYRLDSDGSPLTIICYDTHISFWSTLLEMSFFHPLPHLRNQQKFVCWESIIFMTRRKTGWWEEQDLRRIAVGLHSSSVAMGVLFSQL